MHNRFDQLGKQIGEEALAASGPTAVQEEIFPGAHYADLRHDPDPDRDDARARLGLLGRVASTPCLIELFSEAPGPAEMRGCLLKHLAFWRKLTRDARAENKPPPEPFLWVVAVGRPITVLTDLGCEPASGWPAGVYVGPKLLRAGIVVASELPRERSTLLIRLMAGGRLLLPAVEELKALPGDAPENAVAVPVLLRLRHAIETEPDRTSEEEAFVVSMQNIMEDLRREGRSAALQDAIVALCSARFGTVDAEIEQAVRRERDIDVLQRWLIAAGTRSAEELVALVRGAQPS